MARIADSLRRSNIWVTATFKNDARIVSKAATLHEELIDTLKTSIALDGEFVSLCLFQPLPKIMIQRGDNPLGLSCHEDGLLIMTTVMVRSAEQKTAAYPESQVFLTKLREFAKSTAGDLNLDWEYLNYADESQNPLASYGAGNFKKLAEVALRYDPQQVFQKLCRGGFKLTSPSTWFGKPVDDGDIV